MTVTLSPTAAVALDADVVSLATGDIRFTVPRPAAPHVDADVDQRYGDPAGDPATRAAVVDALAATTPLRARADDIVVAPGARLAIVTVLRALLDDRTAVLLPAPYWSSYPELIRIAGGVPVIVAGDIVGGALDVDRLERARTAATRVVVVNSPRNPDGAALSASGVAAVVEWAARHDVVVLFDQVYRSTHAPDMLPATVADLGADLPPNTVIVDGLSKSHALAGLRIGWCVAPPEVAGSVRAVASHLLAGGCRSAQVAAVTALTEGEPTRRAVAAAVAAKRRMAVAALREVPGLASVAPAGGFFLFPRIEAGALPGAEVVRFLRERHRVSVVDGAAFGASGHVRLSCAVPDDALAAGLARLGAAARELAGE